MMPGLILHPPRNLLIGGPLHCAANRTAFCFAFPHLQLRRSHNANNRVPSAQFRGCSIYSPTLQRYSQLRTSAASSFRRSATLRLPCALSSVIPVTATRATNLATRQFLVSLRLCGELVQIEVAQRLPGVRRLLGPLERFLELLLQQIALVLLRLHRLAEDGLL